MFKGCVQTHQINFDGFDICYRRVNKQEKTECLVKELSIKHSLNHIVFTDVGIWGYACYDCCMIVACYHALPLFACMLNFDLGYTSLSG